VPIPLRSIEICLSSVSVSLIEKSGIETAIAVNVPKIPNRGNRDEATVAKFSFLKLL